MKASLIQQITRRLPLPGTIVRRLLNAVDGWIEYPPEPVLTSARWHIGSFEIRDCREYIQRNIYFLGYYGLRETALLRRVLREGDMFIDIGANLGWFTVLAARQVGNTGCVIAFEPAAELYQRLQRSVEINALTNVTLERLAASDKNGTAILSGVSAENSGLGSIMNESNASLGGEEVRTVKLADYCARKNIERVRLIKIDVEGAEWRVLQGLLSMIERRVCDYLIIEVNDERLRSSGISAKDILELLRAHGYKLYHIKIFGITALRDDEEIAFANVLAAAFHS